MKVALLELLDQDGRPQWTAGEREQALAIEAVCGEIRRQPARRLKVAELARRFHCSPDHFTRVFRKYARVSPEAFMIAARIDAAMTYLRTSSHSIGRIAELLGYNDVYAFSRQFRQKTGRTPSAFRREAGVS
jgi:transcriptional regulator GlxA family with amidase domain